MGLAGVVHPLGTAEAIRRHRPGSAGRGLANRARSPFLGGRTPFQSSRNPGMGALMLSLSHPTAGLGESSPACIAQRWAPAGSAASKAEQRRLRLKGKINPWENTEPLPGNTPTHLPKEPPPPSRDSRSTRSLPGAFPAPQSSLCARIRWDRPGARGQGASTRAGAALGCPKTPGAQPLTRCLPVP